MRSTVDVGDQIVYRWHEASDCPAWAGGACTTDAECQRSEALTVTGWGLGGGDMPYVDGLACIKESGAYTYLTGMECREARRAEPRDLGDRQCPVHGRYCVCVVP